MRQLQTTKLSYLDLVGGHNLHDLGSSQLVSILPFDCYQLTKNRVRQRVVGGALAVEGVHGVLHGLLGIGVVLTYIPEQRDKCFFSFSKSVNGSPVAYLVTWVLYKATKQT